MSWFGPKGVSTMTFSLLVLSDRIIAGTRIFDLAALTVFCSILVHGVDRHGRGGVDRPSLSAGRGAAQNASRSVNSLSDACPRPCRRGARCPMTQPISSVRTTTAMNPPISGQNMAGTIRPAEARSRMRFPPPVAALPVQRDLLVRRGECPGHLEPPLLAEHESQLARRPQPVGVGGAEGRARTGLGQRAQMCSGERSNPRSLPSPIRDDQSPCVYLTPRF